MSLSDELRGHEERVAAAQRRVREVDLEVRAAAAKVAEVRDAVVEAYADADDAKAATLAKAVGRAEEAERGLREGKLAGAERAAQRAETDRVRFATANFGELIEERRPDAEKVVRAFEDAVAALQAGHGEWRAMYAEVSALARLAGRDTHSMPNFPSDIEAIVRSVSRLGGTTVPAPIPPNVGGGQVGANNNSNEGVRRTTDRDVIDFTTDAKAA